MNEQSKIKVGDKIIFYDGVCGLCNHLVQFVIRHGGKFLFCSLQSEVAANLLEKFGESSKDLDSIFIITDYDLQSSKLLKKSKAVFFILKNCNLPWYWSCLRIFGLLPEWILDLGYDLVAGTRYNLFGRYDTCLIPDQKVKDRFIDQ